MKPSRYVTSSKAPGSDSDKWGPFLDEYGGRIINSASARAYLRKMRRVNWSLKELASCSLGQHRLLQHIGEVG